MPPEFESTEVRTNLVEENKGLRERLKELESRYEVLLQESTKIKEKKQKFNHRNSSIEYRRLQQIIETSIRGKCDVVWGNCNATLATKLQKLQNRAARILTFSSYDANADPLLDKLSWRKLADRRHSHIATMVYKSLNNLAPNYLRAKFIGRDNVTSYTLRDTTNKLAVPKPHTKYLKTSSSYSGATLWNSLPKELRQAKSLEIFKSGCKKLFNS